MNLARRSSVSAILFFALSSLAGGCAAADVPEEVSEDESALTFSRRGTVGTVGTTKPPMLDPGFELAPPVSMPAYFDASSRTSTSVSMGWYETGNPLNPQTLVYRQKYDLDGNAVGGPTLIKTFSGLPKGNVGFVDSAATTDDGSGPDTDRLSCYRVTEKNGTCGYSNAGYTCVSTPWACAYTRAATEHKVGRAQLRIKTSTAASAAAPNDHIQVRLQSPYFAHALTPIPRKNSTWLDSTQVDFTSGSNLTYDLKLTGISDLSDITQITVATPDSDGFCINELELLVDGTRAFRKSYGADGHGCQWAYQSNVVGGSLVTVSFGELRRSSDWQRFNPPNLAAGFPGDRYASFVGYRAPELIQYLDSVFGDALRNPANGRGNDAGFLDTHWTTTQRIDRRRLRVVQHVIAQDLGWQGNVAAHPSYELVIRNDATCGAKQWCIGVENVEANSSFSGWSSLIPLIGAGIQAAVNSTADGEMQKAMTAMGGNSLNVPPAGLEYCFPTNYAGDTPFSGQGFGLGSLTLCWAQ